MPDVSYLIVGGLGGLGRAICQWMAGLRAKTIILLSRSGMESEGSHTFVKELERSGVTLVVHSCDVSNLEQLEIVLSHCARTLPPIQGVIQAAMVLKVLFLCMYESIDSAC